MSGGGMGGGLGATLGTVAAAALAPETGGASLLVDAGLDATTAAAITGAGLGSVGGALGGAAGAAASGGNVGQAAESGGIGGFLGGGVSGMLGGSGDAIAGTTGDSLDASSSAGSGVSGASGVDTPSTAAVGGSGVSAPSGVASTSSGAATSTPQAQEVTDNLANSTGSTGMPSVDNTIAGFSNSSGSNVSGSAPQSWSDRNLPSWMGGSSDSSPSSSTSLQQIAGSAPAKSSGSGISDYLIPAGLGVGAISALMPSGSNPVNTTNATNAMNSQNTALPSYNYNKTVTPYTGNWYTYGQRPGVTPMQTNTLTAAKKGGLIGHYAQGGLARPLQIPMSKMPERHFAMGGPVPQMAPQQGLPPTPMSSGPAPIMPQGMLPKPMGMQPAAGMQPAQKPNPLAQLMQPGATPKQNAARYEIGKRIGSALRQKLLGMTPDGKVSGPGGGQDDAVPAKLSQDEYVVPADVTSMLGDGSSNAGGKKLDQMVHAVRAHKVSRGSGFPPKAKSPTSYMRKT